MVQEVAEARRVVARVVQHLRELGAQPIEFHEDNATTQSANVSAIIAFHNRQQRDIDVSVHFNHSGGGIVDRAIGTEVLYRSQQSLAARVSAAKASAGKFIDRGAKHRLNLGFLNSTARPAIMLEVCFVNSRADVRLYQANFDAICRAIATSILGR